MKICSLLITIGSFRCTQQVNSKCSGGFHDRTRSSDGARDFYATSTCFVEISISRNRIISKIKGITRFYIAYRGPFYPVQWFNVVSRDGSFRWKIWRISQSVRQLITTLRLSLTTNVLSRRIVQRATECITKKD